MKFTTAAALVLGITAANGLVIPHVDSDALRAFENSAASEAGSLIEELSESFANIEDIAKDLAHRLKDKLVGFVQPSPGSNVIPDSFIVVLKEDVSDETVLAHLESVGNIHNDHMNGLSKRDAQHPLLAGGVSGVLDRFDLGAFKGYSGKFHMDTIEKLISEHSDVIAFIEPDSIMHTVGTKETEKGAPWGLARVSHKSPLSLSTYNKYLYDTDGGEGVTAYVVDTGISYTHEDFGGRAKWGKTCATGSSDADLHGHGTHCAGTIGGTKYGVAKKAHLVAVKVLGDDGSGSVSDIITGLEYVVSEHNKEIKSTKGYKGAVINMSLGGGKSNALNMAADAAVKAGVHMAVAAGNENQDACNVSPASAEGPVTVGATGMDDTRAYFSNYGKCVDIFAPGVNIESTFIGSPTATTTMSGTSMASPHVVGLLSYFLSLQPSKSSEFATAGLLSPSTLKKHFLDYGLTGLLHDVKPESPNLLAFNGGGDDISDFWVAKTSGVTENVFKVMPVESTAEQVGKEAEELMKHLLESFDM